MDNENRTDNVNRTEMVTRKKRRRKKRYIWRILLLIAICVGAYFAVHIEYFTVTGIAVVGNEEISDEEILLLSELTTGENIFDVHPWIVEHRIKKNLYVEDAKVKRKLPNEIEIIIDERDGKAQFTDGKKYVVTDNDGKVLEISDKARNVTIIEGIKVKNVELKKTIDVDDGELWQKAMNLIAVTEKNDLYFKTIKMKGVKVEAYVYDGLVCKGRYKNLVDSIESGALKAVVFDLYQKGTETGIINIGSNNYCSFTP